jgi:hypothetical protein
MLPPRKGARPFPPVRQPQLQVVKVFSAVNLVPAKTSHLFSEESHQTPEPGALSTGLQMNHAKIWTNNQR